MSERGPSQSDDNPRLNAAITRFLEEESTKDGCDRHRLLGDFGDIRTELEEFFDAHDRLNKFAAELRPGASIQRLSTNATLVGPSGRINPKASAANEETLLASRIGTSIRSNDAGRIHYFGDYELLEEIARGGMGVVYRARQVTLNRTVAVKMILSGQLASAEDVQRFRAEAEAAAHLDHPGIVPVYEVGEHQGQHYFSMGFVDGPSLTSELSEGPLSPKRAAQVVKAVAQAVDYAHSKGVIHRDLKPGNILLDAAGQPRITDFGLAKRLRTEDSLTATGQILGTPSYMPPEQALGRADGVRETADVYSLGAVLYACLTGRPPYQADNPLETLRQVVEQEPVPPRRLNPAIPRDLETICLKCLEKSRRKRYSEVRHLIADLERFLLGKPVEARPISSLARLARWCQRHPTIATLVLLLFLSMTAGTVVSTFYYLRASDRADAAKQAEDLATRRAIAESHARAGERDERIKAARLAATIAMNNGVDLCNRGETHEGVLWLARALDLLPEDSEELERSIRSQLGAWRKSCLPLAAVANFEGEFLAFSSDGCWLLTKATRAGGGEELLLYETASPAEPQWRSRVDGGIHRASFDDAGDHVAVTQANGNLLILSLDGRPTLGDDLMHGTIVEHLAFLADSTRLLTIDDDSTLRLWNVETASLVDVPRTIDDAVDAFDTHASAGQVAVGVRNRGLMLFSLEGDALIEQRIEVPAPVRQLRFNSAGDRIAIEGGDGVHVWDVESLSRVAQLDYQRDCAWADRRTLVTVDSRDARARIWYLNEGNVQTAAPRLVVRIDGGIVDAATGCMLASLQRGGWTSSLGRVQLWSTETGALLSPPLPQGAIDAFCLTDERLLTVGENELRIWMIDRELQRAELIAEMQHPAAGWVVSTEFSPDGSQVLTGHTDGVARLWDAGTGRLLHDAIVHPQPISEVRRAVFSPDGRLIATASHDGTARLWQASDGTPFGEPLAHRASSNDFLMVWSAAFHPKENLLATGTGQGGEVAHGDVHIRLWDVDTGQFVRESPPMLGGIRCLEFSPEGETLTAACRDGTVHVWNTATMQPLLPPIAHPEDVRAVAVHPEQKVIVTGCEDGIVRVWHVESGEPLGVAFRHEQAVSAVDISFDGRWIATASHDGTARVWDVDSGQPLGEPLRHRGQVLWVAFHPSGTQLTTACADNVARVWVLQSPANEGRDEIKRAVEFATGLTIREDGAVRNLTQAEWDVRRDRPPEPFEDPETQD